MESALSQPAPYRLEELGWLQFERLCDLMLKLQAGAAEIPWRGRACRRREALVAGALSLPGAGLELEGPVGVAIIWVPEKRMPRHEGSPASDLRLRADHLRRRLDTYIPGARESLVLTNLEVSGHAGPRGAEHGTTVLGARELGTMVDSTPQLRRIMPSLLGLRDPRSLMDPEAMSSSTLDLEASSDLAGVFVPTSAHERARLVLERHRFVVLTGPPEMGKTAIARMLALAAMTDGWEAHECTRPAQVLTAFAAARRQLFICDDAFGSTEYRPEAAERWARALVDLLDAMDERHGLIWTSRPAPLKAALRRLRHERGWERFPAPGEVLVDAGRLDRGEKALILFRHARKQARGHRLVRSVAISIVEHPHFTPERIRRFVSGPLQDLSAEGEEHPVSVLRAVERELSTPTEAMSASFHALEEEHRALLEALLDVPAGVVDERTLAAALRRHHPGGLTRAPGDLLDRLTDHFLRVTPLGIDWVHPSWRDLVIEQLRADRAARQRFLAACGLDGALLAISADGGSGGERTLPLLVDDGDWDTLNGRARVLLYELEDRDCARLLSSCHSLLEAPLPPWQAAEARSLVAELLSLAGRSWDREHRTLPVFLLESWLGANSRLPEPVPAPDLTRSWIALRPSAGAAVDPAEAGAWLSEAEEWLDLAQLLSVYRPAALAEFGFPDRDRALADLIAQIPRLACADPELRAAASHLLLRIAELDPEHDPQAAGAIVEVDAGGTRAERRWWTPHDIELPPGTRPVSAHPDELSRADLARVFEDL